MPTSTPTLVWVPVPFRVAEALSKWARSKAPTDLTAGSAVRVARVAPASAPVARTIWASIGTSARARRVTVVPDAVPNNRTLVIRAEAMAVPMRAAMLRRGSRTTRRMV